MGTSRLPHELQPLQDLALLNQPRLQLGYLRFPACALHAGVPLFQQLAQQVVTGAIQQSLQQMQRYQRCLQGSRLSDCYQLPCAGQTPAPIASLVAGHALHPPEEPARAVCLTQGLSVL